MKKVAIVVCNFNKQEYIIKCIESVFKSTYSDFDVYVVDNASTDESVEHIKKRFGEKVNLIINEENKGGSGGFNTGIKSVINKGYKYIYLLDNDVIVEEIGLENLVCYLEENNNVGVVGSKIYFMDNPTVVQEFGSFIDFNIFNMRLEQRGKVDFEQKIEIIECDYVPACSALFRKTALENVGILNEDYFVYWDDIDLGHRLNRAGYKVVANSNSKVWHKGGGNVRSNTFGTYYFWRNRINFFVKYCDESNIENFATVLFDEIIESIYNCNYIEKYSSAKTILLAVNDALNNILGRALDNRIFNIEKIEDKLVKLITNKNNIIIINDNQEKVVVDLIKKIRNKDNKVNITVVINGIERNKKQFENYDVREIEKIDDIKKYDLKIITCDHIIKVKDMLDEFVYADTYFNICGNDRDKEYIRNYKMFYEINKNIYYPILLNKLKTLNKIDYKI